MTCTDEPGARFISVGSSVQVRPSALSVFALQCSPFVRHGARTWTSWLARFDPQRASRRFTASGPPVSSPTFGTERPSPSSRGPAHERQRREQSEGRLGRFARKLARTATRCAERGDRVLVRSGGVDALALVGAGCLAWLCVDDGQRFVGFLEGALIERHAVVAGVPVVVVERLPLDDAVASLPCVCHAKSQPSRVPTTIELARRRRRRRPRPPR